MFINRIGAGYISADNESLWGNQSPGAGYLAVTPETATKLSVVYGCVRVLSETIAQLPLHVYREAKRGKDQAKDHPLYPILHHRPNANQTAFEWREMMMWHVLLRGNAFSVIKTQGGAVVELIPVHPDNVTIVPPQNGRPITYRVKMADGAVVELQTGEILHLRGPSVDGVTGMTPIEVQRDNISEALASQNYGSAFYRNGATMPGWIGYNGTFKDDDAKRKFRTSWQEAQTGRNLMKTPVLENGFEYHELSIKHTDLQYLETRKHKDVDLCRMFRVPPHKVAILDKATFSNIEHQALEFVTDTIMPWAIRWEQAIQRDLFLDEIESNMFAKFSLEGMLRGDSVARTSYYNKGIQDGWLTRNEARELEDRNPLDGLDEPLEPLNMTNPAEREEPTPAPAEREEPEQPQAKRMTAILTAASTRIANKELMAARRSVAKGIGLAYWAESFYGIEHARLIADALGVPVELASAQCELCAAAAAIEEDADTLHRLEKTRITQLLSLGA